MLDLIPAPYSAQPEPAQDFVITATTSIVAPGEARAAGEFLAGRLRAHTGYPLPVVHSGASDDVISFGVDPTVGNGECYLLRVRPGHVRVHAGDPPGFFAAVQTLLQLLPVTGPPVVSGGQILDRPRFAHRGAMLDVVRHFFTVVEVKRFIDEIARLKLNVLHLHLTDDQGWRLEIASWPDLTRIGGATQIGDGPGGYYSQDEYRDLVAYAHERHITVIPEIDVPGHSNAALNAYPELNADGVAPPAFRRSGSATGFSSLATGKEITYRFVEDVLSEVAALTRGEFLHLGTDEAHATADEDFVTFVQRVLPLVVKYGKTAVGWHELLKADPPPSAVAQYWGRTGEDELIAAAAARGHRIVLSPATKAYLDMKYTPETPIGFKWAAYIDIADAYGWDPGSFLHGVPASAVLGVEAPLWTETVETFDQVEYMAFPRLAAIAELGWSPPSTHDWPDFARRLAAYGRGWRSRGVNFYRSAQVSWSD
jgi:hexosaminidase